MQTLLRGDCAWSDFSLEFSLEYCGIYYYNCSINEVASHSPFEVMHGFPSTTHADRQLPLTGATVEAADRLTMISNIRDGVYELIKWRRREWQLDQLGLHLFSN